MKKLLTLSLALVMLFVFAGCGGGSNDDGFGGTYAPVSAEQRTEALALTGVVFGNEWQKYETTLNNKQNMNMTMSLMGETFSIVLAETQTGTMYCSVEGGELIASGNLTDKTTTTVDGQKSTETVKSKTYIKDGKQYVDAQGQKIYMSLEDLGATENWDFNTIDGAMDFFDKIENPSLIEVSATADEGARNIKLDYTPTAPLMVEEYGVEMKISYMRITFKTSESGTVESFKLNMKVSMEFDWADMGDILNQMGLGELADLMELLGEIDGHMTATQEYEVIFKPYGGNITLPDDLGTYINFNDLLSSIG